MTLSLHTETDRPVVLVVDDAPSSLGVLCDTLESAGYTVLVAGDGESALQRLELVTPDAILLDGLMPGLSGFDTCRRIKDTPAWAHVPVIFMTGLSETANVVEGLRLRRSRLRRQAAACAGSAGEAAHACTQRPHHPHGARCRRRGRPRGGVRRRTRPHCVALAAGSSVVAGPRGRLGRGPLAGGTAGCARSRRQLASGAHPDRSAAVGAQHGYRDPGRNDAAA